MDRLTEKEKMGENMHSYIPLFPKIFLSILTELKNNARRISDKRLYIFQQMSSNIYEFYPFFKCVQIDFIKMSEALSDRVFKCILTRHF